MKSVGAYEFDENLEIGRGACGVVFKGRNKTKCHEVVAIKEVTYKKPTCPSDDLKMSQEAEIHKALSNKRHENIVTLLHCETQTRHMYFVMELCNGGCLKEYLECKQKLDECTIVNFLKQIAAGLRVAHDMHIVHRDLKPANILLCFSGNKYPDPDNITFKIADFGIGRFLDDNQMANTLCGTPQYTAPEILFGRPHNYKVDLWSLGVIAYECHVGPLKNGSLIAVQGVEIPTNISTDFADLLKGLLEKDENKRFDIKQLFNHPFLAARCDDMKTIGAGDDKKTVGACDDMKTSGTREDMKTVGACDDIGSSNHIKFSSIKTVGVYEYDENDVIGQGAFGVVYKGRNKKELVAIKEFRLMKPRFGLEICLNREHEILKALSTKRHKNIITLLHSEKQKHHMYFVMEFCNGGSLCEYLENKQKLDEYTSVTFLKQIAAGLKVVHDNGIIHRDLKPQNILLCFSGPDYPSPDRMSLKIANFGIGRFLHSDEMATTQCGALAYMAPEVLSNRTSGGYDYRADLWSVGVIAYELLVGSLPNSLIAISGFEIPMNATKEFANLLRGLLENDAKKRFTLKHVLDYPCLGSTIGATVCGPNDYATIEQVKKDSCVAQ